MNSLADKRRTFTFRFVVEADTWAPEFPFGTTLGFEGRAPAAGDTVLCVLDGDVSQTNPHRVKADPSGGLWLHPLAGPSEPVRADDARVSKLYVVTSVAMPHREWLRLWAERLALHEAGHAVMAHTLGLPLVRVTTRTQGGRAGHYQTMIPDLADEDAQRGYAAQDLFVCLAGPIAERIGNGTDREHLSREDFEQAHVMAAYALGEIDSAEWVALVSVWDASDGSGPVTRAQPTEREAPGTYEPSEECRACVKEQEGRVEGILREQWAAVLALRSALLREATLSGERAGEILEAALAGEALF